MGCGASTEPKDGAIPSSPSIDKYDRRDMIGVGNHGRVYRCIYQIDKKEYAWKVVDQIDPRGDKTKVMSMARNKVEKLQKLRDEHIVCYYHAEVSSSEIVVIMDYSKQGSLKKYINKNGKQVESKVAEIAEKVLEGLLYLHDCGVMHKDLKTSNILMFKQQIKLADYGLAEIYDSRLQQDNIKQAQQMDYLRADSMAYMAPEVIKHLGFSESSDVWSLGCVVIQMLTGMIPWSHLGCNQIDIFKIISQSGIHPAFPIGISKYCQDFLEGCLAIIPSQRSTVQQLLKHSFIKLHSKKGELFFQQSIDSVKSKIDNTYTANRVDIKPDKCKIDNTYIVNRVDIKPDKIQKLQKKTQSKRKSPLGQKTGQNGYYLPNKITQKSPKGQKKVHKLRQTVNSLTIDRVDNDSSMVIHTVNDEDITAELQEEADGIVMLNNKKIKLRNMNLKKSQYATRLEERGRQTTEPTKDKRNSIIMSPSQIESSTRINHFQNRYREQPRYSQNDSLDKEMLGKKFGTEPAIIEDQYPADKQYFKKPLKLLKKKIRQIKMLQNLSKNISQNSNNNSSNRQQLQKIFQNDKDSSKLRSYTEIRNVQEVIDTLVARAERDRYLNEQKFMKKQREKDKKIWEQQLKKGAQILKKQLINRYSFGVIH